MKVTLFDYTGAGTIDPARYAANKLIFTKSTRLEMNPNLMSDIAKMSNDEINIQLVAMSNTNPGSWEFIHFSFLIQKVTRAFTHQLVRTRSASYAQQSFRVVEVQDFDYETGPSIANNSLVVGAYRNTMENSFMCYKHLIDSGVDIEDARGVLPINTHTNICLDINMRNFINLTRKRVSKRVQSEYTRVMEACLSEARKVYPWFDIFYNNNQMQAYKDLQDIIYNLDLTKEQKTAMYKKLDIIISGLD